MGNIDNVNNWFKQYQDLKNKPDFNKDGKVDYRDNMILFDDKIGLRDEDFNYEDLISLSSKKDVDEIEGISEEEETFFSDLKNYIYEKVANFINRDKTLSLEDMLKFEHKVRSLDDTQKADVGEELEKIQNRMVSNITSQVFVSNETQDYKKAAPKLTKEVWATNMVLDFMDGKTEGETEETKFGTLLDKMDRKLNKTLSENYSQTQIDALGEEFKKKYFEKDGKLYLTKEVDGKEILYEGVEPFTGEVNNRHYKDGMLKDGYYPDDDKLYNEGSLADGEFELNGLTVTAKEGVITSSVEKKDGKEVHIEYDSYKESTYKLKETYDTTVEPKFLEEKIEYNKETESGDKVNVVYNYYKGTNGIYSITKNEITTYYDRNDTEFKFYGMCFFDGKLYNDGVLAEGINYYNGKLYSGQVEIQGITFEDGVSYEDVEDVEKVITDKIKNKITNKITGNDVVISFVIENGKYIVKYKKGNIQCILSDFTFNEDGKITYNESEYLNKEIILVNTMEANDSGITKKGAKYVLVGATANVEIELPLDNAEASDTPDYSIIFDDVNGDVIGKVLIYYADTDGNTISLAYQKNENGNYAEPIKFKHLGTISDIQGSNENSVLAFPFTNVSLDEEGTKYKYGEKFTIIQNVKDEEDGTKTSSYKIVFAGENNDATEIELGENFYFDMSSERIFIINAGSSTTIYSFDGDTISFKLESEAKEFLNSLGISEYDVTAYDSVNNTITIKGKECKITTNEERTTLTIKENNSENFELVYSISNDNNDNKATLIRKTEFVTGVGLVTEDYQDKKKIVKPLEGTQPYEKIIYSYDVDGLIDEICEIYDDKKISYEAVDPLVKTITFIKNDIETVEVREYTEHGTYSIQKDDGSIEYYDVDGTLIPEEIRTDFKEITIIDYDKGSNGYEIKGYNENNQEIIIKVVGEKISQKTITYSNNNTPLDNKDDVVLNIKYNDKGEESEVKVTINEKEYEIIPNGTNLENVIDYTIETIDADGTILHVTLKDWLSDDIERIRYFTKGNDGFVLAEKIDICVGGSENGSEKISIMGVNINKTGDYYTITPVNNNILTIVIGTSKYNIKLAEGESLTCKTLADGSCIIEGANSTIYEFGINGYTKKPLLGEEKTIRYESSTSET